MKVMIRALGIGHGAGQALTRRLPALALGFTAVAAALWSAPHEAGRAGPGQPVMRSDTGASQAAAESRVAAPPRGLTPQAWSKILDEVRQRSYAVQADPAHANTLVAANPAQHLQARFSVDGVELAATPARHHGAMGAADASAPLRLQTRSINGLAAARDVPVAQANRVDYALDGYREWYVNDVDGLEQGWTLARAPAAGGTAVIQVAVDGGRAVAEGPSAIRIDDARGRVHYRYTALAAWDAAHHPLPAHMGVTAQGLIEIAVNDRGAQYPITVDPSLTVTNAVELTDPVVTGRDSFGKSVAIAGDTVAIGAYSAAGNQGVVYVFGRNQGGTGAWGLQATLNDPAATANDFFGTAVAVDGDTLLVGASGTGGGTGKAYLYGRDQGGNGNWGLAKTLPDPAATANDQFGGAVAISGDTAVVGSPGKKKAYVYGRNQGGNGNWGGEAGLTDGSAINFADAVAVDGDTVVVSTHAAGGGQGVADIFGRNQGGNGTWGLLNTLFAPSSATVAYSTAVAVNGDVAVVGDATDGAALVFSRDQGGAGAWGLATSLYNPGQGAFNNFGGSVAIDGDAVAVGANSANNSTGAAYLYNRNQGGVGTWGLTTSLSDPAATGGDNFGDAVALSGSTLVVGAIGASTSAGAAFIYDISGGSYDSAGYHNAIDSDDFARTVGISGDLVVVGADGASNGRGNVYVFARDQGGAGTWGLAATLNDPGATNGDQFGTAVAVDGDTLAVGACHQHQDRGVAYVFGRNQGGTNAWGLVTTLADPGATNGDLYGCPIVVDGDTVAVAATGASQSQGKVYVYGRNRGGVENWGLAATLADPGATNGDLFASSLALDGDTLAAGAPVTSGNQGAAYVFSRNQGGTNVWGLVTSLADPAVTAGDQFGAAVAVDGDTLAVGATGTLQPDPQNVGQFLPAGEAYLFERNQGGANAWGQVLGIPDPSLASGDLFGAAAALYGNTLVVGSPGLSTNTGIAYIFDRNQGGAGAWGQIATLTNPATQTTDKFGLSVAAQADTVVVGGPTTGVNAKIGQVVIYSLTTGLPAISLSTDSFNFGSQGVGSTSTQTVTITNLGSGALNVGTPTVTGANAGDFGIGANTCHNPVAPGGTCIISAAFTPTTTGSRSATLTISSDAPISGGTVSLSGTGIQSTVTVSGGNGAFGNQAVGSTSAAQTFTLTNTGSALLNIGTATLGGGNAGDFAISANNCGAGIAVGGSCRISVTFTPPATGSRSATLDIPGNASNSPTTVNLSGTGIQAAFGLSTTALSYGSLAVGGSAVQSVTVTNTGSAVLHVATPTIAGGNSGDFAVTGNTCTTAVAVSGTCSISVSFTPAATGSRSATLSIPSDAPGSPGSVSLGGTGIQAIAAFSSSALNYGSQVVGSSQVLSITITNIGSAPLNVGTPTVSGSNAGDFAVTANTCTTAVAVSGSCSLGVSFTPAAAGSRTASLSIPSDAFGAPATVTLAGTGTQAAIQLSASSLAFSSVNVGSASSAQAVTLVNGGTAPLHVGTPTVSGSDAGDFTVTANTCTGALAVNASCSISITFKPKAAGSRSATLDIPGDASNSPSSVNLSGTGTQSSGGGALPPGMVLMLAALAGLRQRLRGGAGAAR